MTRAGTVVVILCIALSGTLGWWLGARRSGEGEPSAVGGRQRESGRRADRGQPRVAAGRVRHGRHRQ